MLARLCGELKRRLGSDSLSLSVARLAGPPSTTPPGRTASIGTPYTYIRSVAVIGYNRLVKVKIRSDLVSLEFVLDEEK